MGNLFRGMLLLLTLALPATVAAEVEVRLRLTWGGGPPQPWEGSVTLSEGDFSDLAGLGLEVDSPGSLQLSAGEIRIGQKSASSFHGFDVTLRAPAEAVLHLVLGPRGEATKRFDVPLADLAAGNFRAPLDDRGNVLELDRAPGDRLFVRFDRSSLVFAPGERFELSIEPRFAGLPEDRNWRIRAALAPARGGTETWLEERERRSDPDGELTPSRIEVPLPDREGVYDLRLSVSERRIQDRFLRPRPVLERTVQLVVIAEQPRTPGSGEWNLDYEFDPSQPRWWERYSRWIQLRPLSGGVLPADNGRTTVREVAGLRTVEVAPEGWQAYPLPIDRTGTPHLLEIEFPQDSPQTFGISIIEPNAAGDIMPVGLDSGVHVLPSEFEPKLKPGKHRLVFWPRTATPLVLITNRSAEKPAWFRAIRVYSRTGGLPPAVSTAGGTPTGRLVTAHFEKPLFTKNFGADQALDAASGRCRDDWVTFHEGGNRLLEYLRFAGYNAAVIPAYTEGSTLYPSRLLQPTPKYDTGLFFASGQDPVRKDVLEALFRMFDREGLTLIPSLQFSAPLPALERMLAGGGSSEGLLPLDSEGIPWINRYGAQGGFAPYYNPLDPRVQEAILAVVEEVVERYGHHASFGGISLQLGPNSFLTLPAPMYGLDDQTTARFAREAKVTIPGSGSARYAARAEFLSGDARPLWLQWKAKEITSLHGRIRERITARAPRAKLYLAAAEFANQPEIREALRPSLPRLRGLADTALPLGLDPKALAAHPGLVLLQPRRIGLEENLLAAGPELELAGSADVASFFAPGPAGLLLHHEPAQLRLESFDTAQPLRARQSFTWLVAHLTPHDAQRRKPLVQALAARDFLSLGEGGWLLPLGQEDACRELYTAFSQLPAEEFTKISAKNSAGRESQVTLRRLQQADRTWFYLAHDAPWPLELDLSFTAAATPRMLAAHPSIALEQTAGACRLHGSLRPYDFLAWEVPQAAVEITAVEAKPAPEVKERLGRQVRQLAARTQALRDPVPATPLRNPGFEAGGGRVAGWVFKEGPQVAAEVDATQHRTGEHSLKLTSRVSTREPAGSIIWVRSEPLDTPASGRLALKVWLRVEDPRAQPPLRLAIEGKVHGRPFYRAANVGLGPDRPEVTSQWTPFIFPLTDLPPEITDLRIGFDLMGPGEVWIDDVELFDLWFHENERAELTKIVGLADFQLGDGRLVECARLLEGYWPRYLTRFAPAPAGVAALEPAPPQERPAPPPAAETPPPTPQAETPAPQPAPKPEPEGWFDWVRRMPGRLNPF